MIKEAIARVVERIDLTEAEMVEVMSEVMTESGADAAGPVVDSLLRRIAGGSCLARLEEVAGAVLARELPIMLWEAPEDGTPGAVISGLVDLVYRDPDDGKVVVADYKTDAVDDEAGLTERAGVYEPQVRTYAKILRDALDLEEEPHTELWFLAADRIVRF